MDTSDFMLQLAKQLVEVRGVAESTATTYVRSLYQLNGRKPFKNLAFLRNVEDIEKILSGYAESTQKALTATIVSVLSLWKTKPTYKKLFETYEKRMYDKAAETPATADLSGGSVEKTAKQKENWLTWDAVLKRKTELRDAMKDFPKRKALTAEQYETLLQHFLLSLYTDIQPRRNQDYLDMYIVRRWNEKLPTDKNYLDLEGKRFVFNKYKTAKRYGTQMEALTEPLLESVSIFLNRHPLWKGAVKRKNDPVKLLAASTGEELTANNAITRILNRVFGGKKVGCSMLRHIYISDKYKGVIEEQMKDASAMAHSLALQKAYYKAEEAPAPAAASEDVITIVS
jgi:hypothetical protein